MADRHGETRRRKHWGWGYEDEQPSLSELRAQAAAITAHLGFGRPEPEAPAPLPALAEPRAARAGEAGRDLQSDDSTIAPAMPSAARTRDVVRGFRGIISPPTRRRRPAARRGRGGGGARVGARRRDGGHPLRRGHERRRRGRAAGPGRVRRSRDARPRRSRSGARDRPDLAVRPASRPARRGPRLEAQLANARHDASLLPPVVSVLDPRRLARDARRRALRDRVPPTSTTSSSRCGR